MKAYQLIFVTSYSLYDDGFSFDREETMPGPLYLHFEKAQKEKERIWSLSDFDKWKYTTRSDGYLSCIIIKKVEIIE